jgi:hypothetical protein
MTGRLDEALMAEEEENVTTAAIVVWLTVRK